VDVQEPVACPGREGTTGRRCGQLGEGLGAAGLFSMFHPQSSVCSCQVDEREQNHSMLSDAVGGWPAGSTVEVCSVSWQILGPVGLIQVPLFKAQGSGDVINMGLRAGRALLLVRSMWYARRCPS
jgi:hypothetical protein